MIIPIVPRAMSDVMSRIRSIIIVEIDLLDGFLSCRYRVLMRSPLFPGVNVPTNVPIMETLHESFSVYSSPIMSIIFFQRRPFTSILDGIIKNARSMYSGFEFVSIRCIFRMSVWDIIAMKRSMPMSEMYFVDIFMCLFWD